MYMTEDAPVFLIASERSGTNLLRKKITEAQDYYFGPSPAHFYKHLFETAPFYGYMQNNNNFKKLISFALELCYNHFAPWDIEMTEEEILKEYSENFQKRNAILLGHFLMNKYAKFKGYQSYFCKDNFLYNFIFAILHEIPNAKFVYLFRDPRDYTVSQLNRSLYTNNVFKIAQLWRDEQIKALSAIELLSENQVFQISYEEFITNEEEKINQILNYLNLKKTNQKQIIENNNYSNVEEWENLTKPTLKSNYNKYLKELSAKRIKKVESICWHQMIKLKYIPVHKQKPQMPFFLIRLNEFYFFITDKIRRFFINKKPEFKWNKNRNKAIKRWKTY